MIDYYEILGVSPDAPKEDIKKAFHKKARELHPDVNKAPDAEEKFKELNEAYSTLSDENKKREYDLSQQGFQGSMPGMGGFEGIFNEVFGGGFGNPFQARRRPPQPTLIKKEINILTAMFGGDVEVPYQFKTLCESCNGTGASSLEQCSLCHGAGFFSYQQGTMYMRRSCHQCGGAGQKKKEICQKCNGSGYEVNDETAVVSIKPGFSQGRFAFRARGDLLSREMPRGDLLIDIFTKIPDLSGLDEDKKETLYKYFNEVI